LNDDDEDYKNVTIFFFFFKKKLTGPMRVTKKFTSRMTFGLGFEGDRHRVRSHKFQEKGTYEIKAACTISIGSF
jgi:hypothetical protein